MALSKIPNYLQDLIDSDAIGSSAISSAKIGSLPSGSVIQTVYERNQNAEWLATTSTATSAVDALITPQHAGSSFIVLISLNVGLNRDVADTDFGASMVYRVGGSSSNFSDYTGFGGNTQTSRENPASFYPFYSSDTWFNYGSTGYGSDYNTFQIAQNFEVSPSYNIGQSVHFRLLLSSDRSSAIALNHRNNTAGNGGGVTTITLMEIAG